jgi:regulator of cell morphogenesis and NO signaling
MKELALTKVSKIVATNFQTAKVFTQHGIDFCCNGGIPLDEACRAKGLSTEEVVKQVERVLQEPDEVDFEGMSLPRLVSFIINVHHTYVETTIPVLQAYLDKLCVVHGDRHPELFKIKKLYDEGARALMEHMLKEEQILFPYINSMYAAVQNGQPLPASHFGDINNPITMMEMEHSTEGERFKEIASISSNYQAPADGCQTYKVAFAVLEEFEKDLHKHIHLENNILFPRAKTLFETMNTSTAAMNN